MTDVMDGAVLTGVTGTGGVLVGEFGGGGGGGVTAIGLSVVEAGGGGGCTAPGELFVGETPTGGALGAVVVALTSVVPKAALSWAASLLPQAVNMATEQSAPTMNRGEKERPSLADVMRRNLAFGSE
ncbi:MAG TPA: hypothetical protein VHM70_18785 [Polyangiaceae bacterium]|nr:hypothetical protein [Polyangiaceae bacterium]